MGTNHAKGSPTQAKKKRPVALSRTKALQWARSLFSAVENVKLMNKLEAKACLTVLREMRAGSLVPAGSSSVLANTNGRQNRMVDALIDMIRGHLGIPEEGDKFMGPSVIQQAAPAVVDDVCAESLRAVPPPYEL